jgi:hypothetical protein
MLSIEQHGAVRRFFVSRWVVDLKAWIDHLRGKFGEGQTLSAVAKRRMILQELRSHNLQTVVETGTFLGDTAYFLSSRGYQVITVEIAPKLAALARARFSGIDTVTTVEGDSGKLMPKLVADLIQPALFYLDGHYSGGETEKGELETPVVAEVEAILAGAKDGSVVIIDDARCFGASPDFPDLAEFLTLLKKRGVGDAVVIDDTVRFCVKRKVQAVRPSG